MIRQEFHIDKYELSIGVDEALELYADLGNALGMAERDSQFELLLSEVQGVAARTYDIAAAVTELQNETQGHWLEEQDDGEPQFNERFEPVGETLSVEQAMARMQVQAAIAESPQTGPRNPGSGIGSGHG